MNYYYIPTIRLWQKHKDQQAFKDFHRVANNLRNIVNVGAIRLPNTPVYVCLGQEELPYMNNVKLQQRLLTFETEFQNGLEGVAASLDMPVKEADKEYIVECVVVSFSKPQRNIVASILRAIIVKHKAFLNRLSADLEADKAITESQASNLANMRVLVASLGVKHPIGLVLNAPPTAPLIDKVLTWAGV
jgi:hypothetical protein